MTEVFVVQHLHEIDDVEDVKMIGVYSSRASAEAAVLRLSTQPGFRENPAGFHIDPYSLDQDHWIEGFSTLETIYLALENEGTPVWRPVHAELRPDGHHQIVTPNDHPDAETWPFVTGDIVVCQIRTFSDGRTGLVAVSRARSADRQNP